MSAVHGDAVRLLTGWQPVDEAQRGLQQAFLGFLAARPDACTRCCVPGHLTASTLVLSHDGTHVLLTLHPKVGRWVQLGGHCEDGDAGLAAAALREATEESGIDGLVIEPEPLHLDVHPITCSLGVPTRHFDVRFLVRAPRDGTPVRSVESVDLRWWPVDALPTGVDTIPHLTRLALGTGVPPRGPRHEPASGPSESAGVTASEVGSVPPGPPVGHRPQGPAHRALRPARPT
ncbi:MAG: NUDIX domain-containing protein [Pseudonocardiaceae bacterium]|nr:NUDIX domain-containing protein [Pseudonocardiaceae bacterium]